VACLSEAPDAREVAEAAVAEMNWFDPEGYMSGALILGHLGSRDLALHALGLAVHGGYSVVHPLLHDPWLAALSDDRRFQEILQHAEARRNEALTVFRAEGGERVLGLRAAA